MNKQDKQKELERLHDLVFEGAPDWATHAAMDNDEKWWWYLVDGLVCQEDDGIWGVGRSREYPTKKVIKTTLDWTETLIQRKGEI